MSTREHRKHIPLGVRLHVCLLALGFTDEEIAVGIEWDHHPALALRFVDPDTGQMHPHPNDPHFIQPLRKAEHHAKTNGNGATSAGSDKQRKAKIDRIAPDPSGGEEFRRRLLSRPPREERQRSKWPSRPFPKKAQFQ